MKVRIEAMIAACHQGGKKFIWAIGGYSDATKAVRDDQVQLFASKVVQLLKVGGDGIDFDWEHLSDDPSLRRHETTTMGSVLYTVR